MLALFLHYSPVFNSLQRPPLGWPLPVSTCCPGGCVSMSRCSGALVGKAGKLALCVLPLLFAAQSWAFDLDDVAVKAKAEPTPVAARETAIAPAHKGASANPAVADSGNDLPADKDAAESVY